MNIASIDHGEDPAADWPTWALCVDVSHINDGKDSATEWYARGLRLDIAGVVDAQRQTAGVDLLGLRAGQVIKS
jgi:hypothetical protein